MAFAMSMPYRNLARPYFGDPWLIMVAAVLVAFGFVMAASASVEFASLQYGDAFYLFKRQLVFLFLGLGCCYVIMQCPMRYWYKCSIVLLLMAYLALILVLIPGIGSVAGGGRRWFRLGIMSMQASEPAKLCIVVFMAWFLARHRDLVRDSWKGFTYPMIFLALPVLLLLMEPDFGAVVVLSIAVFGMLFLAGVKLYQFILAGAGAGLGAAMLIVTSDYRMRRVDLFLQALKDPFSEDIVFDGGYQLAQALIGFGRGEWFGVGLGNSIQKMYFLPDAHTDYILAIVAEELGLVGVLVLLLLFVGFVVRALQIARRNELNNRLFAAYLGYGIAFLFLGNVLINMAVNVGLLPTKGLTLPFVSYGGSSLLMCLVMVGILLRIDIEHHQHHQPRAGAQVL
jgi:cell division protein FtsW